MGRQVGIGLAFIRRLLGCILVAIGAAYQPPRFGFGAFWHGDGT